MKLLNFRSINSRADNKWSTSNACRLTVVSAVSAGGCFLGFICRKGLCLSHLLLTHFSYHSLALDTEINFIEKDAIRRFPDSENIRCYIVHTSRELDYSREIDSRGWWCRVKRTRDLLSLRIKHLYHEQSAVRSIVQAVTFDQWMNEWRTYYDYYLTYKYYINWKIPLAIAIVSKWFFLLSLLARGSIVLVSNAADIPLMRTNSLVKIEFAQKSSDSRTMRLKMGIAHAFHYNHLFSSWWCPIHA